MHSINFIRAYSGEFPNFNVSGEIALKITVSKSFISVGFYPHMKQTAIEELLLTVVATFPSIIAIVKL